MNDSTDPDKDARRAIPMDSALPDWLKSLPDRSRSYAALARWDRPVGIWLLLIPCWIGLAQMRIPAGFQWIDLLWIPLFAIGAVAMRGAGCTWNDIRDRDIDAEVERTAMRPLPSGDISLQQAYMFLAGQLAVGLLVWLCLPTDAKIVALLSIPLVAAYPYMKRITWWPQAWLGFTFNFGVLVGAATATSVTGATVVMYLGLVCWTVAYDTIYALQDREDDAMLGVKSTARLFGTETHRWLKYFLAASVLLFGAGLILALTETTNVLQLTVALCGVWAFGWHLAWQLRNVDIDTPETCLRIFRSNREAGAIPVLFLAVAAVL